MSPIAEMAAAPQQTADKAVVEVEKAVAKARPWIEPVARLGYAAKGLVYALIGVVAMLQALHVRTGQPSNQDNQRGIINLLARQPFGLIILSGIAIGLAGYALWRLISATINAEGRGTLKRLGYAVSGITYGYLAFVTATVVLGSAANADDRRFARTLIQQPFGEVLLVIAGLIVLGIGIAQAWNSVTAGFIKVFKLGDMSAWERSATYVLGRIGLFARAILFGLIGGFLILAGVRHNAQNAGGLSEALKTLQHSVGGNWLLGLDCSGLVCYGLFMLLEARYRRIVMTDPRIKA